jgi:hypothetical protein
MASERLPFRALINKNPNHAAMIAQRMENSDAKKWKSNRSSTDEKKSKTIAKRKSL